MDFGLEPLRPEILGCRCFFCAKSVPPYTHTHTHPSLVSSLVRQDGLAHNIREAELMPKSGKFWGCVLYFVAKLDSPVNIWEVVYGTTEKM